MKPNYLNLLGLAYRARKCSLGEETIVRDIQRKRAHIVLLANDIGPQTRKRITDKCRTYNIPYVIVDNRDVISQAIGKRSEERRVGKECRRRGGPSEYKREKRRERVVQQIREDA